MRPPVHVLLRSGDERARCVVYGAETSEQAAQLAKDHAERVLDRGDDGWGVTDTSSTPFATYHGTYWLGSIDVDQQEEGELYHVLVDRLRRQYDIGGLMMEVAAILADRGEVRLEDAVRFLAAHDDEVWDGFVGPMLDRVSRYMADKTP